MLTSSDDDDSYDDDGYDDDDDERDESDSFVHSHFVQHAATDNGEGGRV